MEEPAATATGKSPAQSFYDRMSAVYDLIADRTEHAVREEGLEAFAAAPGESVLEIGFGTGHGLVALAGATGPAGRVIGVDLSFGMLQVARRRLRDESAAGRIGLIQGDARHLPLPADSLDAAFCSFTLELFSDDDMPPVLAELRRVLRAGGRLGAVSMAKPETRNLEVGIFEWLHRHFPHVVDCRPIDGAAILEDNGFEITVHRRRPIWGLPIDVLLARVR